MSDALQPHESQHARPPCPSPTPGAYSNACPLSWWCHPTISSSVIPFPSHLQSFPASVFSSESVLRSRWPKYWSFSFNISPSNEHPGLISFRMDWLDLLAVQGTLKSLFQHHSSKASILWCPVFFIVQLSHPYMTTGKAIALTRWTFVGKVMSLLYNMLSRLVIAFIPRSKCLLISSAYLRLLIFLLAILIPACASSSPAFLMVYSAYKLNKQGDNIQPWCTPFPIWNQCVVPCPVLTVASWPAYRFLERYSHVFQNFPQFIVIHTVKGFGIVNKAEIDVFWNSLAFSMIQQSTFKGSVREGHG